MSLSNNDTRDTIGATNASFPFSKMVTFLSGTMVEIDGKQYQYDLNPLTTNPPTTPAEASELQPVTGEVVTGLLSLKTPSFAKPSSIEPSSTKLPAMPSMKTPGRTSVAVASLAVGRRFPSLSTRRHDPTTPPAMEFLTTNAADARKPDQGWLGGDAADDIAMGIQEGENNPEGRFDNAHGSETHPGRTAVAGVVGRVGGSGDEEASICIDDSSMDIQQGEDTPEVEFNEAGGFVDDEVDGGDGIQAISGTKRNAEDVQPQQLSPQSARRKKNGRDKDQQPQQSLRRSGRNKNKDTPSNPSKVPPPVVGEDVDGDMQPLSGRASREARLASRNANEASRMSAIHAELASLRGDDEIPSLVSNWTPLITVVPFQDVKYLTHHSGRKYGVNERCVLYIDVRCDSPVTFKFGFSYVFDARVCQLHTTYPKNHKFKLFVMSPTFDEKGSRKIETFVHFIGWISEWKKDSNGEKILREHLLYSEENVNTVANVLQLLKDDPKAEVHVADSTISMDKSSPYHYTKHVQWREFVKERWPHLAKFHEKNWQYWDLSSYDWDDMIKRIRCWKLDHYPRKYLPVQDSLLGAWLKDVARQNWRDGNLDDAEIKQLQSLGVWKNQRDSPTKIPLAKRVAKLDEWIARYSDNYPMPTQAKLKGTKYFDLAGFLCNTRSQYSRGRPVKIEVIKALDDRGALPKKETGCCDCNEVHDEKTFGIQCGECRLWYTLGEDCVGFDEDEASEESFGEWYCSRCVSKDDKGKEKQKDCVCGKVHDPKLSNMFWAWCEICHTWYNVAENCVRLTNQQYEDISEWHCLDCTDN